MLTNDPAFTKFLKKICWGRTLFYSEQLQVILVDNLLAYLRGKRTLAFVVGLGEIICTYKAARLDTLLLEGARKLHDLGQIKNPSTQDITDTITDVLQLLTKRV